MLKKSKPKSNIEDGLGEYVTLTENNDWEGESWNFYIPVTGNTTAIATLADSICAMNDESFELDTAPIPESSVNTLVRRANKHTSYMLAHNKLSGKLTLPTAETLGDAETLRSALYKGKIESWMK